MAEIKKIVLDIDGVEVSLTPLQAGKLYDVLNEFYGKPSSNTPIVIERWVKPWDYWQCNGASIKYDQTNGYASFSV
jgi:hypothetical protein